MKKIMFIQPGPAYSIREFKFNYLSNYFSGEILTTSDNEEILATKSVGKFSLNILRTNPKHSKRNFFIYLLFCIRFCIKLRFFKKENIDLVVTYDPLKTGLYGIIASRILSCKFAPEINGTYSSKYNFMDKSTKYCLLYAIVYTQIMKFVFTFSHGIKYQYPGQISFFENKLGKRVVSAFPNLVNLEKFTNISEEKEILVTGFPFWRKGIDVAIDAFKLIAPKYPDWKMKILGWYPDLTPITNRIGDCTQIYHHPPVCNYEMPDHVGRCAIVCCPSRSEGVPRILMEAMMAGKPRIGSNADGIPVVIKDGYDGLLFESRNVTALSEKMTQLMDSSELRKVMGLRGQERVVKEFGQEQYFSKLIDLYNKLCA